MATKKKPAPAPAKKVASESSELGLIRKLAEILNETGLTEIELDHKGARVRVSKSVHTTMMAGPAMAAPVATSIAAPSAAVAVALPAEVAGTPLKSPMVGTAYLTSAPGAPPFVEVGSMVKQGQTVLIIEAMKTMNQIAAPKDGKVVKIVVEHSQPVEFGETLMVIE
jgi:acetyl-CoA carboxylase biotin carboxyl carrier protein